MHSFTFNGHSSEEFGIRIERFPNLNRSERKYKSASVAGRNGNIYQMQNAWEEVVVSYQIFAGKLAAGAAVTDFTDIVEWLNSADDYAVLTDTYDPTHYRMAVFVDEMEIESQWHTFGKATVKFRCRPQRYIVQTPVVVSSGGTITNNTNHAALPIITLTGTQIIPNLLDLEATYTYPLDASGYDIWTDWFLSYMGFCNLWTYSDGTKVIGMYSSSSVSSKGGSLSAHTNSTGTLTFKSWLNMGGDVGVGVGATLTPDTDYTISCTTTSGNSKIQAIFYNSESPKSFNSIAEASRSGAGTLTLTFHVPVTCSNVLFMFYRPDNTSGSFTSIMLNTGTTAAPFVAYGGESTDSITINDTTLSFNHRGFTEAVIDCERENFTVDGANSNNKATLLDQYGNLSDEYLCLAKGNNAVSYTANITAVSVQERLWEL